jgi:hypothetical protein
MPALALSLPSWAVVGEWPSQGSGEAPFTGLWEMRWMARGLLGRVVNNPSGFIQRTA